MRRRFCPSCHLPLSRVLGRCPRCGVDLIGLLMGESCTICANQNACGSIFQEKDKHNRREQQRKRLNH
ncbi:MAG: hypothetical protein C7B43_09250 [Sulfobacillus benefaciens]|uniref:Uncharacterized protein n=1 Tax=Sulfobacillus benefaciens TaxID=453960 RepID=A0A2T2X330_9FIRM|nr:MAG: hypothetical protein C7B43_09250 [Sulfobacillus benefaciens]HBQ96687.1 hypothetical protein [Sulfobacillus sp.]